MLEDPMIVLSGASNISFQNITLENMRGIGVYIEKCDNNTFENCTFRNIGMVAIVMGKGIEPFKVYRHDGTGIAVSRLLGSWHEHIYDNPVFDREAGKHNGIVSCRLYNIGMGAISLGGGNRKTLEAAGNYVVNSEMFDFNRLGKTYKAAVNVDGVGNRIANNHIYNADQSAIYIHGNNHLIEYNEINNTCQAAEDMGAIYMGRDPSEAGNIIRYNYLHHIIPKNPDYMVAGIYFDDGDVNGLVYGNVFFKTGNKYFGAIFNHGGHGHLFENNIFIDCPRALGNDPWDDARWFAFLQSDLMQLRLYKAVEINKPPYSWQYPDLAGTMLLQDRTSKVIKNLVVQCDEFSVPQYHLEKNWVTKKDPGFLDFKNENFQLKADAEVFRQIPGFSALPFQNMGIQIKTVGNPYDKYIL
jgi:parallel beta-helix repeat protein